MDQPLQDHYLEVLRQTGSHAAARRDTGVSRDNVAALLRDSEEFQLRVDEALELFRFEQIEQPLHGRAVNGVLKDIWWNGQAVGQETVYSDRLLALMARANVAKYRDKVEVVSTDKGSLDMDKLSPESQRQFMEILEREAKLGNKPAEPKKEAPPRVPRDPDEAEDESGW